MEQQEEISDENSSDYNSSQAEILDASLPFIQDDDDNEDVISQKYIGPLNEQ